MSALFFLLHKMRDGDVESGQTGRSAYYERVAGAGLGGSRASGAVCGGGPEMDPGRVSEYEYVFAPYYFNWRHWNTLLEQWLTVSMERGTFEAHHFRYLTECVYRLGRTGTE